MTDQFDVDAFFQKAKPSLDFVEYQAHPTQDLLTDYVYGQLDDENTFFRISAHVATCRPCFETVSALKEELTDLKAGLTAIIEMKSPPVAVKEHGFMPLKEIFNKLLNYPAWTNRKRFYGHFGAYAVAGLLLLFTIGIANTLTPRIILESSATASGNIWPIIFRIALGGAVAWGTWGLTGLAYHAFRAFRKKNEKKNK